MPDSKTWDWEVGKRLIEDTGKWKKKFEWIEEFQVSPDGEEIASIVKEKVEEEEFGVCINGNVWENKFDISND